MSNQKVFNHAISIDEDICIGCSHCMKVCPTEALRVWNGKAILDEAKCVDCGDCFRVCPVKAIYVKDDHFVKSENNEINVALIPAVFFGQFSLDIKRSSIYKAIEQMGFSHVFEVEESVEFLSDLIVKELHEQSENIKISSYCPAIVRLIQTRFPEMVSSIVHVKSPVEISALHGRRKLEKDLISNASIRIFYITPCAAKAAAIHNPESPFGSPIHGTINLDVFFNHVTKKLKGQSNHEEFKAVPDYLSSKSITWSLSGGESKHMPDRCLSIDGMQNAMEFLEKIDLDDLQDIDFLEIKACDQGCAGGILNPKNRFLCVESLQKRAHLQDMDSADSEPISMQVNEAEARVEKIEEHSVLALSSDPSQALKMMNKTRRLMCYLPGFDCGACGAPTCKSLAEDVAKGDAILSHCVFMQRQMEKHHRLSPDHAFNIIESIWGKDRLDKDCNKKGAINDY